jgi:hypothetical protein
MTEQDDELVTDEAAAAGETPAPTREEYEALRVTATRNDELLAKMAKTLTDPDVAEVLRAKEEGRALRLTIGGERDGGEGKPAMLPTDIDLDAMTPSQLVKEMMKMLPGVIAEGVRPVVATVDGLAEERMSERKASVTAEANALVEKYPDFLDYRDKIKQLVTDNGLKLEEAYVMARMRDGKGYPVAKRPASAERPSGMEVTFRGGEKRRPAGTARMGARGFQDMTADVLDNMVINAGDNPADGW